MKNRYFLFLLLAIIVASVSALIMPYFKSRENRVPIVNIHADSLLFAIKLYHDQYNSWPTGDSRSVSASLMGQNLEGTVFIEGHGWTNQRGELIDPWGTPFIYIFESNVIKVSSAGPNGTFGDADDKIRQRQF